MTEDLTTRPHAAGPRTAALLERVQTLEAALATGGDRVPEATATLVRSTLTGVRERLALGVDHTVVALVGGTGSGKSSVFNALTGLELADVGVRRPTTSQVTACAWAHDATGLLDWLGVSRDRRMDRESPLDGESQADLRGLVLLDLPDHDSIEPEHRAVVDRLLPLVDLLVWVVDPQKYADDALHTGYLRHLVGHEAAMLVVLNQIDTVPVGAQAGLLRDVARLLEEDGLTDVGVHAISARTGEGVPTVREVLAGSVAGHGIAEVRAVAEVDDAARALASGVGASPDATALLARDAALEGLAEAAGVSGIAAAVEQAVRRGWPTSGLRLGPVQADRAEAVNERWLADVGGGLPELWQASLRALVPTGERLVEAADERLRAVDLTVRRSRAAVLLAVLAAGAGVAALLALGLTVGSVAGQGGFTDQSVTLAVVAAGAGALAALLWRWASAVRAAAGRRAARDVGARARAVLAEVVDDLLSGPSDGVLADHRAVWKASLVAPPAAGRHRLTT